MSEHYEDSTACTIQQLSQFSGLDQFEWSSYIFYLFLISFYFYPNACPV